MALRAAVPKTWMLTSQSHDMAQGSAIAPVVSIVVPFWVTL